MQQKYGKLAIGGRLVGVFFGNAKPVGKLEVGRSRIWKLLASTHRMDSVERQAENQKESKEPFFEVVAPKKLGDPKYSFEWSKNRCLAPPSTIQSLSLCIHAVCRGQELHPS